MIQTKIQFSLGNAKRYFREHLCTGDYYSEARQVKGEWFGLGAEKLGLKGTVRETDFLALCEGQHPGTGHKLGQRINTVRREAGRLTANRRIFFDFTIAPPKSVSVVALYQDERIVALHNRAVRAAMAELETFAATRVRKSGANGDRPTGNVIGVSFRHETSRELDPHLHTHCVVFNATFDPAEDRWKALETADMYRAQSFAANLYRHELCRGLRDLGYQIENHARGFEIKGVPASVVALFSKRHRQIDDEAAAKLAKGALVGNVKELRERIAHGNRRRKLKDSTADRLRPAWSKEMQPADRAALASLRPASVGPRDRADVAAVVAWAEEHLFERRAVVNEHELMASALERGRGQDFALVDLRRVIAARDYVREAGSTKLTSREALGRELEVVMAARDGRNRHAVLNGDYRPSSDLTPEQAAAVERILGTRDFVTLLRGGAGTGKSFALKEIERGLVEAGRPVVVLAPQRQQVQDLEADGLKAETLASRLQSRQLPRGAVVVVDEAGQIGTRELCQLVRMVRASDGRLILSGDTHQHGAVAASDALRAIEKHSGLKPAVIRAIRRQDPERATTWRERVFIRSYRRAVRDAADGRATASFERLERLSCVRELPPDQRRDALAAEYLAAFDRKESALVVAQTREEMRNVNETIRDRLRDAGHIGAGSVLATYAPVDLNDAQKRDGRFYSAGQSASFLQRYGRYAKRDLCAILGANERGVVIEKGGRRSTLSYRYTNRILVCAPDRMAVAPGDRLQLKFNGRSREGVRLNNGEIVTVRAIRADGRIVVEGSDGGRKTLEASQRLFVRGFAVTSYGSQGKTVDTVLFSDAANRAATSAEQWYVTISRGRRRVVVFTSDKAALRSNIQHSGGRELAVDLKPDALGPRAGQVRQLTANVMRMVEQHRHHADLMSRLGAAQKPKPNIACRV